MNRHPNPWSEPVLYLQHQSICTPIFKIIAFRKRFSAQLPQSGNSSRKSFTFSTYDSSQKTVWNLCTWGIALSDRHTFRGCLATCHKGLAVGICSVLCKSANHTTPGAPAFSDLLRAISGIAYTADTDRSGWLLRFGHCPAARTHSVEGNWCRIFTACLYLEYGLARGAGMALLLFFFPQLLGLFLMLSQSVAAWRLSRELLAVCIHNRGTRPLIESKRVLSRLLLCCCAALLPCILSCISSVLFAGLFPA